MTIQTIELTNFRSYETSRFQLHPNVTLVVGPNASGKTNMLESLFVVASTKSFRAKDRDLVRHQQDHFRLVAATSEAQFAYGLSVAGGVTQKKVTHDGVKVSVISHIGQIQVTLFEPTELDLLSGPPEGRRRYLDFILCQTDRSYLKTLQNYRRVLRQRNALLGTDNFSRIRAEIFAWDMKLAELAIEIYNKRVHLIAVINSSLPRLYADIAGHTLAIEVTYLPSVTAERYADEFVEMLAANLPRDFAAGFTTIGPHREDFKVSFRATDIMSVASRGEVRTVVLALKLAEIDYAHNVTGMRPILLLDDVFSELDSSRRSFLLGRLSDYQTVITTTDADAITRELNIPHSIIHTQPAGHV